MSLAADAADRLLDDPVVRGAHRAGDADLPAPHLTSAAARKRQKKTQKGKTQKGSRPVRQVPPQSAGGTLLARAEIQEGVNGGGRPEDLHTDPR